MRIEELKRRFQITIRWRAFPLHPETPEEGLTLEELFAGRDIDVPKAMAHLRRVSEELGLPWGDRKRTYNSSLAQEMGKWAEDMGKGEEFHMSVFRAYFVDGKNIGKKEVLTELAAGVGLPKEEGMQILQSRRYKTHVDEDWRLSQEWFIRAVPTFVMDHRTVVGAQPYKVLAEFLRKCKIPEREIG